MRAEEEQKEVGWVGSRMKVKGRRGDMSVNVNGAMLYIEAIWFK